LLPGFSDICNGQVGFPSNTKFFLLRHLGNSYIRELGNGQIAHEDRATNELTLAMLRDVSGALLNLGFQSRAEDKGRLLEEAVKLLDGRNDGAKAARASAKPRTKSWRAAASDSSALGGGGGRSPSRSMDAPPAPSERLVELFAPPEARYNTTLASPAVTAIKCAVLDIFTTVAKFRANFLQAKALERFKKLAQDPLQARELRRLSLYVAAGQAELYQGGLPQKLAHDFDALFTGGDGAQMELSALAKRPVEPVLLDCLMLRDWKHIRACFTSPSLPPSATHNNPFCAIPKHTLPPLLQSSPAGTKTTRFSHEP
jgi:hypothetical protein